MELRYGCNPHQKPAQIYMTNEKNLPFEILSGAPGYINFCDALNSWQLVKELKCALKKPAAASFKHVSPAGVAVYNELNDEQKKAAFVDDSKLSPLAVAYARARSADRMSSFGDWAALSDICDEQTALLLKREVSDGVIAPGYSQRALEILREKRNGNYAVVKIDENYLPYEIETKQIFGITLSQKRNDIKIDDSFFDNIVTKNKNFTQEAKRDLIIALITLKYTQSNSVAFAYDGQIIGVGAGQQSRVHCTRLAGNKADRWFLRHHPKVLNLSFKNGISRADKNNAIDCFLEEDLSEKEIAALNDRFDKKAEILTKEEKITWLSRQKGVTLASDAFFPFRDNIDRAVRSGVEFISQPGGSVRDNDVVEACDEYGITMAFSGIRLFHH
ncbi:MAG: phosphoribosylaminoimidazolecarboxamide formyltransferase [Chitinispirillales bacterium]|jgi:AICAR transformylase/IMP cyclohydrolase PurH|nr:phosphoribosylaminoimidazolecarboxamide formyltransferase [Chitinispirillales bacterium]